MTILRYTSITIILDTARNQLLIAIDNIFFPLQTKNKVTFLMERIHSFDEEAKPNMLPIQNGE